MVWDSTVLGDRWEQTAPVAVAMMLLLPSL